MRELRNAACEAASRGWYVVPLRPGEKRPATRNGLKDATDDLVRVFQWWEATPNLNVGVVCNASGLIALDIDPRHGGDDTFADVVRTLGPLPQTVEAETGGGGWHYLFKHPGGTLRGSLGAGIDVKDHGYILISPSLHPSGRRYEWSVDGHPDEVELAELPPKWVDAIQVNFRRPQRDPDAPQSNDPLRRIPAATYVARITGREPDARGFFQCPFHGGGTERTPSLRCEDHMWACYGCGAIAGKRCAGGNIYDFAALTMDLPIPLRGADYLMVKDRLRMVFDV